MVGLLIVVSAVMVSNRSKGYADAFANQQFTGIKYGQDDNYFQLLHVLQLADSNSANKWNVGYFSVAVLLNPVPRFFWPNKPLLTQEYYGEWKRAWETISFVGELVAMFGKWGGMISAMCFGLIYYQLLLWSYKWTYREFGLVFYLAMAFYIYMALRSIHNIGMYIVYILFVLLMFVLFQVRRRLTPAVLSGKRFCNTTIALQTRGKLRLNDYSHATISKPNETSQ